jgi:trehalose 6-phosphate synthase/phosphatase
VLALRLIIVANRLPVTAQESESHITFQESAGGLVSGLLTYVDSLKKRRGRELEYLWIGWPGLATAEVSKTRGFQSGFNAFIKNIFGKFAKDKKKERLKARVFSQYRSYPVFLSERDIEGFYHGFCNSTLWPLFHYFPSYTVYDPYLWESYKKVNEAYCDAVLEVVKPDDVVWIHDYQLMLVPTLLREKMPDLQIGFFLHIPFPVFEIFRLMPKTWREELVRGMLGSDLIGFHTHEYTQYFLQAVLRILGLEHTLGEVMYDGRVVKADTFPMGIDFAKFHSAADEESVKRERGILEKILIGNKVIFSVDRLDYTKGIVNRLKGYEALLEKHERWHGRVVLVMVVVPSRTGVEQYQKMKKEVDELVGRINGRFGNLHWTPIIYQYRSIYFEYLAALYGISDVALVTPLRDGMNLVAKEYVATKEGSDGVLILSEMAGASKELGEAIIINPNHLEEITDSLNRALEMPEEEMRGRNAAMQERLRRYDVFKWADDFLSILASVKEDRGRLKAKLLRGDVVSKLSGEFVDSEGRLIFLDYDGTLVPFEDRPEKAVPPVELLKLLEMLAANAKNDIVIVSGRDKRTLDEWFHAIPVGFAAEHGAWVRERGEDWKALKPLTGVWIPRIRPVLELYTDRLPGSFVEEKEYSIAWHYRKADPEMASLRKAELMDELVHFTAGADVQVLQGSKVIEVRNAGVSKGLAGLHWVEKTARDCIIAVGDDWTDEELFKALPPSAWTIRVGVTPSNARYNVRDHADVLNLLRKVASVKERT